MFWFLLSILLIYFILLYFNLEQRKYRGDGYRDKIMTVFRNELRKTIEFAYQSTKELSMIKSIQYSNYSVANLESLKNYMNQFGISRENIHVLLGFDLRELENRIYAIQRRAIARTKS